MINNNNNNNKKEKYDQKELDELTRLMKEHGTEGVAYPNAPDLLPWYTTTIAPLCLEAIEKILEEKTTWGGKFDDDHKPMTMAHMTRLCTTISYALMSQFASVFPDGVGTQILVGETQEFVNNMIKLVYSYVDEQHAKSKLR